MFTFVLDNNHVVGSALMRGKQLVAAFQALEVEARWVTLQDFVPTKKETFVIFVKIAAPLSLLQQIHRDHPGVHIVYDTVDILSDSRACLQMEERYPYYHTIVTVTQKARSFIYEKGFTGRCFLLPHHWDPRLAQAVTPPAPCGDTPWSWGFMGSVKCIASNLVHYRSLLQDPETKASFTLFDTEAGQVIPHSWLLQEDANFLHQAIQHRENNLEHLTVPFQAHISVRNGKSCEFRFKTNAKLSTAAALGQPLLCTKEDAFVELLPSDYPLFLEDDRWETLQNKLQSIAQASAEERQSLWEQAVAQLAVVKQQTSVYKIASLYIKRLILSYTLTHFTQSIQRVSNFVLKDSTHTTIVYRALFGKVILGSLPQQERRWPGVDYLFFTDQADVCVPKHYQRVYLPPLKECVQHLLSHWRTRRSSASVIGTLSNRVLKILLPQYLPSRYKRSLYLDAQVPLPLSLHTLCDAVDEKTPLLVPQHPVRSTPAQEIQQLSELGFLEESQVKHVVARYETLVPGSMTKTVLTENNVLSRYHTPQLLAGMHVWLQTLLEGIPRDQVSLQMVLKSLELVPNTIDLRGRIRSTGTVSVIYPTQTIYWDLSASSFSKSECQTHWPLVPELYQVQSLSYEGILPHGISWDATTGTFSGTPQRLSVQRNIKVLATGVHPQTGNTVTSSSTILFHFHNRHRKQEQTQVLCGVVLVCSTLLILTWFKRFVVSTHA